MCRINGKKLSELRRQAGMSATDIAKQVGVSATAIKAYYVRRMDLLGILHQDKPKNGLITKGKWI